MYHRIIATSALTIGLFGLAVACDTPRGQWPNCRTIPGHPEWDESGWYCEGIVTDSKCGCSNATKRVHLGPFCAVNAVGADIRFERTYPNRVGGSTVCTPVSAPSGDVNAWGDGPCSDCMASKCKAESWACYNEPGVCRCLDFCQKGSTVEVGVTDLNTCGCDAPGSPTYDAFWVCAQASCLDACFPDPNAGCICP